MPFTQPWFEVDFGSAHAAIATTGYRLYQATGADSVARTTTGVVDLGNGAYGVPSVNVPDNAVGIEWDTGGGSPVYAREDAEPYRDRMNLDAAVSTRAVQGDEMALEDDAITLAKFDETTAWPLEASDTGATEVARTGADADTLETLSDQIDALPTAAAIATDVWSEALPGAFGAGEAGNILGNNLDAAVSSRAAPGDAMDLITDALDADALATSALAELNTYLEVTGGHGAGLWQSATVVPSVVAAAVWDELLVGHTTGGSAAEALKALGYADGVWVDTTYGSAGTAWPKGTRGDPVDNWANMATIMAAENVRKARLTGYSFLVAGSTVNDMTFEGDDRTNCGIDLNGQDVSYCEFRNLIVTGDHGSSPISTVECTHPTGSTNMSLIAMRSEFLGTHGLAGGMVLTDCFGIEMFGAMSAVAEFTGNEDVKISGWTGDIEFSSRVLGGDVTVNVYSGDQFRIANDCSGVDFTISGLTSISNQGLGGSLDKSAVVNPVEINLQLSGSHGGGSWEGSTAADVATAVWSEALPGAFGAGEAGQILGDNLDLAISSLNDLSQADVQTAMTAQGYTAVRGALLDFLDAAISSRSSHDAADVDTELSGTHGSGSWEGDSAATIDALLSTNHGAGSWEGTTPTNVAAAVWDALAADYSTPLTMGGLQNDIANFGDTNAGSPFDPAGGLP